MSQTLSMSRNLASTRKICDNKYYPICFNNSYLITLLLFLLPPFLLTAKKRYFFQIYGCYLKLQVINVYYFTKTTFISLFRVNNNKFQHHKFNDWFLCGLKCIFTMGHSKLRRTFFWTPFPLWHAKMTVSLITLEKVSQKFVPPFPQVVWHHLFKKNSIRIF